MPVYQYGTCRNSSHNIPSLLRWSKRWAAWKISSRVSFWLNRSADKKSFFRYRPDFVLICRSCLPLYVATCEAFEVFIGCIEEYPIIFISGMFLSCLTESVNQYFCWLCPTLYPWIPYLRTITYTCINFLPMNWAYAVHVLLPNEKFCCFGNNGGIILF